MQLERRVGLLELRLDRARKQELLLQLMDTHLCGVSQGQQLLMKRLRCSLCLGNGLPVRKDVLVDTARLHEDRENPLHRSAMGLPRAVASRVHALGRARVMGNREGARVIGKIRLVYWCFLTPI